MAKVTKRAVDQLVPGDDDKFLWDDEVKGFGLRCRPSGAKIYFLKSRVGRRQRWLTIGRHGSPWTVELARKEARRLLGEIVQGKDPGAEREAERTAVTVAELCDLYLAGGYPGRCRRCPSWCRVRDSNPRPSVYKTGLVPFSILFAH